MPDVTSLDYSQISAILPHGRAMMLVDRVETMAQGVSIVGIKAVTGTEDCYRSMPRCSRHASYAYPVSLLIESFGQTAALLWLSTKRETRYEDHVLMFVAARDIRIEGEAFPGDVLRHCARIEKATEDTVFVTGEAWVENRRVASIGSMIAVIRPRSFVVDSAA